MSYTPEIEDIRVGYECEICPNLGYEDKWIKVIGKCEEEIGNGVKSCNLDELTYDCLIDGYIGIRTQYLTKEQIESEGWEFKVKSIDLWFEQEVLTDEFDWSGMCNLYTYKPYKLFLNYGLHDHKLQIKCDFSGGEDFSGSDTLFEGYCPSINELRTIQKLLKINPK